MVKQDGCFQSSLSLIFTVNNLSIKKFLFFCVVASFLGLVGYKLLYSENPATATNLETKNSAVNNSNAQVDARGEPSSVEPDTVSAKVEPFYGEIRFLTGKIKYSDHPEYFVKVAEEHCTQPMYMHNQAYSAFKEMWAAAKKDGIALKILSGARNYESQKGIWERKWQSREAKDDLSKAKNILEYSSMPMSSRHHWGTDIDLNSLDNDYFSSGKGKKEYEWLVKNAPKFKFCQVYTENENDKLCGPEESKRKREGYRLEKWHWSYMPVSSKLFENYNKLVENESIKGFKGSELAGKLKIKEHFVGGISDTCKCVE